jgi:hypothetical protein
MSENKKLVNKVKRLVRKAGFPRWLHYFGPKKYEFFDHAVAYLVKQECRLGYRRVTRLLRWLGKKCPCPSALCTSFNKIPLQLWQKLLKATAGYKTHIVAIDSSGMSRSLPSPHYVKRIDKPYPIEVPLKLSVAVDTRNKRILALRLRARKWVHDIKDVKYLIKRLPVKPNKIVADKGYDANWLHEYCHNLAIQSVIPARNYGSNKIQRYKTKHRKMAMKIFTKRTYNRREIVESVFGATKRKFGPSVSSVKFSAQRAEMYCRAITHNIIFLSGLLFERSPSFSNLFKWS